MRPQSFGCERGHGAGMEDLSLDGAAFDHGALLRVEPVQTRGQQQLDRRRDREVREVVDGAPRAILESQQAVVDQHADHLLDEQRIPLRGREDPFARGARQVGVAQQVVEQRARLVAGERFEQDRGRVHLAAAPAGADLEQLGSGDTDEQQFCVARPIRQVLDQIQQERLRPMDVVEHHDERPLSSQMLEQLSHAPRRVLGGRGLRPAEQAAHEARDAVAVFGVTQHSGERGERRCGVVGLAAAGRLPDDLAERVVRDPLSVGEAPAAQHGRVVGAAEELADEPRLADARGAEQREQMGGALVPGSLEPAREQLELFGPARPSANRGSARDRRCRTAPAGAARRGPARTFPSARAVRRPPHRRRRAPAGTSRRRAGPGPAARAVRAGRRR